MDYKFSLFLIDRSFKGGRYCNYQFVKELLLSNRHILQIRPPNDKLFAQVLPVETPAKGSKHDHICSVMWPE